MFTNEQRKHRKIMNKKILIVEDENSSAVLIKRHLESIGYTVASIITSGEEAIKEIKKNRPDLVLMDITLEGKMDGIDTATYVNEKLNVPVVYITSSSDSETLERAKESNPFGYIIKPFDKKDLKATIEMALMRFEMELKLKESEQKLRTILNSIGDAVLVLNGEDDIIYANPVAEKITGWEVDEILEKNMKEIFRVEYSLPHQVEDLGRSNDGLPIFLTSKNGERVPIHYSVAPIVDEKKNNHTVIVIRDDSERYNSEEKLKESFNQLRKTMGGIIQAMAYTIETRDPYTAGHQRRVADLARAIATDMNLDHSVIESIRMAGIIHDIGKVSVPAEILSKPGRLTNIEFNLIKMHPEIGFEILHPIEFPWPIAAIVQQHHEKNDGSGYPLGLMKNEIMFEAKILSVADVVEAMASHRPYRAALGIELALDEITKNRGILYDKDVVDTVIHLFRKKNYTIK